MAAYRRVYDSRFLQVTAKNRDQLRNHTLGNRVWVTFSFLAQHEHGWKYKNYVIYVCFHCHGTSSYHTTDTLQGRRAKSHVDTQTIQSGLGGLRTLDLL